MIRRRSRFVSATGVLGAILAFALIAAACGDDDSADTAASDAEVAAAEQAAADAAQEAADAQAALDAAMADDEASAEMLAELEAQLAEAEAAAAEAAEAAEAVMEEPMEEPAMEAGPFSYTLAIFSAPTTDNPWAASDTEADVWNSYVIPGQGGLYGYQGPTYSLVPNLASDPEPPPVVADGDGYSVTVNLDPNVLWSDGTPKNAHDVVFTYDTLVKYNGLGGNFLSTWPLARPDDPETEEEDGTDGVSGVEALDDHTVKISFNFEPGLAIWPYSVGTAPVYQAAFWGPHVDASDDSETLYAVGGLGSPNGGAFNSAEWEPGAFWRNEAISDYYDAGSHLTVYDSGVVEYTSPAGDAEVWGGEVSGDVVADYVTGPYASEAIYSIYSDQNAAVLALTEGEVDFLLNPLGLQAGLRNEVLAAGNLEIAVNEQNGFRYLAYNTRKFPMSEQSFRHAIGCMIDKDFMANTVLGGTAIPSNSLVPPGQGYWHNPDVAAPCAGMSAQERFEAAVATLKDAGWTWDVEPGWDEANRDVIPKGEGLRGPDGTEVQDLTLLSPGPGYDPMRATYSLFIEEWANDLGIPVTAEPTGFSVIVDKVFPPADPLGFDMYILGWGLTPFPDHVFDFFISANDSAAGGYNTPGYNNPEFDALGEQFTRAKTLSEARDLIFQAEAIIAEDLPYVVLFTTPIIEAYSNSLAFPFTVTLDGLQNWGGLIGSVDLIL